MEWKKKETFIFAGGTSKMAFSQSSSLDQKKVKTEAQTEQLSFANTKLYRENVENSNILRKTPIFAEFSHII